MPHGSLGGSKFTNFKTRGGAGCNIQNKEVCVMLNIRGEVYVITPNNRGGPCNSPLLFSLYSRPVHYTITEETELLL